MTKVAETHRTSPSLRGAGDAVNKVQRLWDAFVASPSAKELDAIQSELWELDDKLLTLRRDMFPGAMGGKSVILHLADDKQAAFVRFIRDEVAKALQRPIPSQKKKVLEQVLEEILTVAGGKDFSDKLTNRITQEIVRAMPRNASMAQRVASRHLAYNPGQKSDTGYLPGNVQQQAPYRGVGSQTPVPHDRDGQPMVVETQGMMKIPGYEWHDQSPEFHKLAGGRR